MRIFLDKISATSNVFGLLALVAACAATASGALAAGAGCDAGKWPLSAIQTHFGGTLPSLSSGDSLPALGAPVLVNLSA